jgi:hypothetical protein
MAVKNEKETRHFLQEGKYCKKPIITPAISTREPIFGLREGG